MYFVYRDDVDVTERFVQTNQLYSYNNAAANASDAGVYTMFHESQGKKVNCQSLVIIAGNLAITYFNSRAKFIILVYFVSPNKQKCWCTS